MSQPIDWSSLSTGELADEAAVYRHDHDDGSEFFFEPHAGTWRYEQIDPAMLSAFDEVEQARDWLAEEIRMHEADGNHGRAAHYRKMLAEGFEEPVTVGQVGEEGRLWDGWHRTAIAIIRAEKLPALVGVPPSGQMSIASALRASMDWIDQVPADAVLPTMPGFDRDWVESLFDEESMGSRAELIKATRWALDWIDAVPAELAAQLPAFNRSSIEHTLQAAA